MSDPGRRFGSPTRRGALVGLVSWLVPQQPFVPGLEEWLHDAFSSYRSARPSATRVVLIGLDDASLGTLPEPLTSASPQRARVVAYLRDRGAKAIGLDLMIPEPLDAYDLDHGLEGRTPAWPPARPSSSGRPRPPSP
jgi:CHASE2 domain-containing sensor protein